MTKYFLLIFVVYIVLFSAHALYLKKTAYGDGIYYYSWLRSIVIDHDINFANEYTYFSANQPKTSLATLGNKYAIGPAILWAPGFLIIHSFVRGNGYTFPYQLAAGLSSVLYAMTGLILLFRLFNRLFTSRVSVLAIASIAGTTNLLFYGAIDPVNSHAVSFFAVTVFLTLLFTTSPSWFFIGVSLGIVGLMRIQDLVIGLLVLSMIKRNDWPLFLIGALIGFLPQLIAWQSLYGNFLINPYLSGGEGFSLLSPHTLDVLFSVQNGLFLWTPSTLLGFIGLFFAKKFHRLFRLCIVIFLIQLLIVSSWSTWWQGASYSGRMFVSTLPIIAIGLGAIFQSLIQKVPQTKHYIPYYILSLSIINGFFILRFLLKT